ncbi:glycosyltransferase family 2 protein [bacterium]|nr:glycosyltransferase family 2 protein [bacterium]MCI0566146.1 glycosyltransferase family 2 protein [bacterium]
MHAVTTSLKPVSGVAKKTADTGVWFLFFAVIYIIILIKFVTIESISHNVFFGFYSILISAYILSRFLFAYFHRSIPINTAYEPTVTFVVPAKNEEDNIAETIRRFSQVNYPLHKVEVITINDASTDGTLREMMRIKEEIGGRIPVTVVNWEQNKGKRAGMAEGVKRSRHEIIIFVDSDSFIDKDCVRHLVKYFAEPSIGAVCGHSDVWNADTNILTRMQAVRYYIAFKVYKGAESIFGSVTCCPGCCSAYRKSYCLEFIDEWLNQTFLGAPCTFGDDRSLTNFIIKKYKAAYSPEALAWTVVPEHFPKYFKQQQRWKKSWIRETFIAASFMWRKNILSAFSFYAYVFLAFSSPIVFFRAVIWEPASGGGWPLVYLGGIFLMLLLHGLYYRTQVGKKAWFLAIINFWFNTVLLIWQLPWALVTLRDNRWGTR